MLQSDLARARIARRYRVAATRRRAAGGRAVRRFRRRDDERGSKAVA